MPRIYVRIFVTISMAWLGLLSNANAIDFARDENSPNNIKELSHCQKFLENLGLDLKLNRPIGPLFYPQTKTQQEVDELFFEVFDIYAAYLLHLEDDKPALKFSHPTFRKILHQMLSTLNLMAAEKKTSNRTDLVALRHQITIINTLLVRSQDPHLQNLLEAYLDTQSLFMIDRDPESQPRVRLLAAQVIRQKMANEPPNLRLKKHKDLFSRQVESLLENVYRLSRDHLTLPLPIAQNLTPEELLNFSFMNVHPWTFTDSERVIDRTFEEPVAAPLSLTVTSKTLVELQKLNPRGKPADVMRQRWKMLKQLVEGDAPLTNEMAALLYFISQEGPRNWEWGVPYRMINRIFTFFTDPQYKKVIEADWSGPHFQISSDWANSVTEKLKTADAIIEKLTKFASRARVGNLWLPYLAQFPDRAVTTAYEAIK